MLLRLLCLMCVCRVCPPVCVSVCPQIFELTSFAMEITTKLLHKAKGKQKFSNLSFQLERKNLKRKSSLLRRPTTAPPLSSAYVKISTSTPVIYVGALPTPYRGGVTIVYTYFIYSKSKSQQCIQLKSGIEKWLTGSLHVLPAGGGGGGWGFQQWG